MPNSFPLMRYIKLKAPLSLPRHPMSTLPTTEQPGPLRTPRLQLLSQKATVVGRKVTTRHGWVGDYDYAWLCMPSIPFFRKRHVSPPFYGLESEIPLLVAITCGLQHALAMLAGLITPPIIIASSLSLDSETSAYMISASLIGCGKAALLRVTPGFLHAMARDTQSRANVKV